MAVSAASLTTGNDIDGNSTATTSSVTPGANKLILVTVNSRNALSAEPNVPTLTGNGLTYVAIANVYYDTGGSSRKKVTLFRAMGASPSAGAISISFGGQNQTTVSWTVDEISGIDTSGTNGSGAIVQSATNVDTSGLNSSITATLATFSGTDNATYGTFALGNNGAVTFTPGSGFAQVSLETSTAPIQTATEFKASGDVNVDGSFSVIGELGVVAVEIKAAAIASLGNKIDAGWTIQIG